MVRTDYLFDKLVPQKISIKRDWKDIMYSSHGKEIKMKSDLDLSKFSKFLLYEDDIILAENKGNFSLYIKWKEVLKDKEKIEVFPWYYFLFTNSIKKQKKAWKSYTYKEIDKTLGVLDKAGKIILNDLISVRFNPDMIIWYDLNDKKYIHLKEKE